MLIILVLNGAVERISRLGAGALGETGRLSGGLWR
jgi:hypothetical protein